jgi:hypothetical protein
MKLTDLNPQFLKHAKGIAGEDHGRTLPDGTTQWGGFEIDEFHYVDSFAEAHGIKFLCPVSFTKNGGAAGTHSVHVYFTGSPVPDGIGMNDKGETVRWGASGTGYADLTLTPSILEQLGAPCWHGYVTNGEVSIL